MDARKSLILKAIVDTFIKAADPVGSNHLLKSYKMNISSATIRNDMAYLEEIGLIYQPHISSGRVPTSSGFRLFVDELMDEITVSVKEKQQARIDLANKIQYQEVDLFFKDSLRILSDMTTNVSFITLPWKQDSYYLGVSHVLKKPEFSDAARVSSIVEVLEDKDGFMNLISDIEVDRKVKVYIGEENIIAGIKSCSILVTSYYINEEINGVIGVLGPTRMRYAYNISALEGLRNNLEEVCKKTYFKN